MSKEIAQEGFICPNSGCSNMLLKLVAKTKTVDGGGCGDGYRYEFYRCPACRRLYHYLKFDFGSWEPFDYAKEQTNLELCSKMPDEATFYADIDPITHTFS